MREDPLLAWAIIGTLLLKLGWLLADRNAYYILGDSASYLHESLGIRPGLSRPFGYPAFLKFLLEVIPRVEALLVVQWGLSLLASGFLVWIALDRFRNRLPVLAALVMISLWPWTGYFEKTVLAETLAIMLLSLFVLLLLRRDVRGASFLTGLTLATGVLVRPVTLCLVPAGLVWFGIGSWRRRTSILRSTGFFLSGVAVLLLPYAAAIRLIYGASGITHFDGWTLFGLVGGWTEPSRIDDPGIRAVFEEQETTLSELSPARRKWAATGPAKRLLAFYASTNDRPEIPRKEVVGGIRQGDILGVARRALARTPDPWVMTNESLRSIALQNIQRHPLSYTSLVLRGLGNFFLSGGEHRRYFQSPRSAGHPYALADTRSLELLESTLRAVDGRFDWPGRPSGFALRWAYRAYSVRAVFLILPILGVLMLRRNLLSRPEFSLLFAIVLLLAIATCAVSEVYDRYTALTTPLLLFVNTVVLEAWLSRRALPEPQRAAAANAGTGAPAPHPDSPASSISARAATYGSGIRPGRGSDRNRRERPTDAQGA